MGDNAAMSAVRYARPTRLDEALALLANDPTARCISGGATLVAMMNARLADPGLLVALDGIDELRGLSANLDGSIRIGGMTRHRETASSELLTGSHTMLRQAAGVIANTVVRNMGTMGGSIAFADPGADYPPALVATDAEIEVAGASGVRRIAARDFFVDWYTTALEQGEIVAAIHLPAPKAGPSAYYKHARTSGDFAIASMALALDGETARIAFGNCGPVPLRLASAENLLAGRLDQSAAIAEAGRLFIEAADPVDDVRGSADYRKRLIPRLLGAGLAELRARGEGG